jgi:hypothetical protein
MFYIYSDRTITPSLFQPTVPHPRANISLSVPQRLFLYPRTAIETTLTLHIVTCRF